MHIHIYHLIVFPTNENVYKIRNTYKLTIQLECETQWSTNDMIREEIYNNNRRLSQRRQTELLTFEPPQSFEKEDQNETQILMENYEPRNWRAVVCNLIHRFGKETTIHGLNHLCNRELSLRRRILWFIAFGTALLAAVYMVILLAARFNRKQFETVIESTKYPAFQIPFPEVIICNKNRLNWKRLEEAQQMFLTGQHQTAEMREHFASIVGLFDNMTFGQFELFNNLPEEPVLQQLNYVNFTNVVDFMSWRCEELFYKCIWRHLAFNCCDIFTRRRSQLGQCLSFNNVEGEEGKYMLSKHPKWPWRNGEAGADSGLKLRIVLNEKFNFPNNSKDTGVTVMLVEPYAFSDLTIDVYTNTTAMIAVTGTYHFFDNYTRSLHPRVRECIFEGEQQKYNFRTLIGHKYMYENCQAQCQQLYILYYCNCTLDLIFPPDRYSICKLVDFPCLAQYNNRVQRMYDPGEKLYINTNVTGMACKCFLNCFSLTYTPEVRFLEIRDRTADDHGKGIIDLNIFYKSNVVLLYRTSLVFTWVDLLVSFGGIAGLFLGCSLMSIVELGIFFFIGVPKSVLHHHQQMRHQRYQHQKSKQAIQQVIRPNLVLQENFSKA